MSTQGRRVAIFGATSEIAVAFGRLCAEAHDRLVLVGRDPEALERLAADLKVRGADAVAILPADFNHIDGLSEMAQESWAPFAGLDLALVAYGTLPDQKAATGNPAVAAAALHINFVSPALLCDLLAARFEAAKAGTLAVITSVAGDRGRQSNYVYGAAKGGLQLYLEGLRHRLWAAGVRVVDIRPGFVATRMTAHLPQGGPLWATPERVAADMDKAIRRGSAVLYTPWFWRIILLIVRALPRPLFHRSKL
ncbi:SDR family oxidoreductase [Aquabacter sp. L1I39]|uniref:SDR family oxidoreductase n=1 Tax=Aquabacter sp. L1I39 TaxID=2820278 RepID=UPI001ADC6908|nr:SDR family oxidoreductase [Aquabacter sp. L1I39]QTL05353.1 SDR family oxidoreductase [Aquabacter sp. L1I39]